MSTELYWHQAILAARQNGKFDLFDRFRASQWTTCACSQQDPRIPRKAGNRPEDQILASLGVAFQIAVNDNDPDKAESTLAAIEKRAAEILQELANAQ